MKKIFTKFLGVTVIVILTLIPVFIWIFMSPLSFRFSNPSSTFRSLGQITGLLGMTLLSISFILSARFVFLDKLFSGLNRVYVKHHTIGSVAFCLLLFHPIFLFIEYLQISLKSAFLFILPGDIFVDLGKVALIIFIILIAFTFYFKFKYQNWKNTHKFLGIVLILGIIHMLFVPSDISGNFVLACYMSGIAILGVISYFYRTILGIYKATEYEYKLEKVIKKNDNVAELIFSPLREKIKFLPGQFVFLRFNLPPNAANREILSESHPFSIASCNGDHNLSLGVKALGDFTSIIYLLKPGALCKIEGPFGAFSFLKAPSKRQIWIAGGIGITPFLSMAREINFAKIYKDYKIDLYYSARNNGEMAFLEEFRRISENNANFKFYPHFSENDGRLSADYISQNSENIKNADIFLCGSDPFMKNLRNQFKKLDFNNNKIYSEEFSL